MIFLGNLVFQSGLVGQAMWHMPTHHRLDDAETSALGASYLASYLVRLLSPRLTRHVSLQRNLPFCRPLFLPLFPVFYFLN